MAFYFQDDFWESAKALPEQERTRFCMAVLEYAFDGKEPDGEDAVVLAMFALARGRIDLSKARAAAGSFGGSSSKRKANTKQTPSKTEAKRKQN